MTRAMEMISVVKLRPAQEKLTGISNYFIKIQGLLSNFLAQAGELEHSFLKNTEGSGKIVICLLTSDTGLCGSYNQNILRAVDSFISHHRGKNIRIVAIGKKGSAYYKKQGLEILNVYSGSRGRYNRVFADQVSDDLIKMFVSGDAGAVYIAYTRFDSPSRLSPVIEKFLNIEISVKEIVSYGVEPDLKAAAEGLIMSYLVNKMRYAVLNAFVSEHSSRGMAMGEATDNAKEILQKLILLKNKIRQANITREIIEVISTSNALKG